MDKKIVDEFTNLMPRLLKEFSKRGTGDDVLKGHLSVPQMIFLQIIHAKNMCAMSDIAGQMGVTTSAVTGFANRLIRSKLITRNHGIKDRRMVIVSLTDKGRDTVKRFIHQRQLMIKKSLQALTPSERKTYLGLVKKIYTGLIKQ